MDDIEPGVISAALEAIEEAIGIYDVEERLVLFNARYAALRSAFGTEVVAGARWDEMIAANLRAGAIPEAIGREDFWLEQRRRGHGAYTTIRQTADGKTYRVKEQRVPGRGIAVVWTEITRRGPHSRSGDRDVYVICSSPLVRQAFQLLLESSGLVVVGVGDTFSDGHALSLLRPKPGLIVSVLDAEHEAQAAPRFLQTMRALRSGTKMIIVTKRLPAPLLQAIVETGVEAILTTDVSSTVLARAIDLVLLNQRVLPTEVGPSIDDSRECSSDIPLPLTSEAPLGSGHSALTTLSQREHEILRLLAIGRSNKEIARELSLRESTVKVHIKNLLRKTRTTNRTQAAIWCLDSGVYDQQSPVLHPLRQPAHIERAAVKPNPPPVALNGANGEHRGDRLAPSGLAAPGLRVVNGAGLAPPGVAAT